MGETYGFEQLREIVATLRGENGCPWDKVQTHDSLKPCVMEEATELVASIRIYDRTGSADNLCEELGDLLLQVFLHSQIAQEEGLFSIDDVVQGIAEKMIRRHPHVFGSRQADTPEAVLKTWDEIKQEEKAGILPVVSPLRDIPQELPALSRAVKVLKKCEALYGHQEPRNLQECAAALEQELTHRRYSKETVVALLGSLLMQIAEIAVRCQLSAEQILGDKTEDLIETYEPFLGQKNK